MSDLKIWTFDQMRTPALQLSLMHELTAPAWDSSPSPERRGTPWPARGLLRAKPAVPSDTTRPPALMHWARENVPAPEAALQCLEIILRTHGRPVNHPK